MPRFAPLALVAMLAATGCAQRPAGHVWNGGRGYDGRGDYGYDLNGSGGFGGGSRATQAAARYRAQAGSYRAPGPPHDPWGPHIRAAANRFRVPDRWIRAVMQQESGGRLYGAGGGLITSHAGAMGLMQVMPATYEGLASRHGLGPDPYDPRDNILAGAAYIREMADRFGAPNFLAAYNAGPERTQAWLDGTSILPDETTNYLARVAPRLGGQGLGGGEGGPAPSGLFAASARPVETAEADLAFAGGGLRGAEYFGGAAVDPADRAFEGGGLVSADAPTGR